MLRVVAHLALSLPLIWIVYRILVLRDLGPDPAEQVVRHLGLSAACVLWAALSATPLRHLTGSPRWVAYRRAVGLWAFAYATLHFLAFLVMWAGLDGRVILEELSKRPYMAVGFIAWLGLVPLAVTSTKGWRRRLGRRWQSLHRLVYPISLLVLLHIAWIAKLDYLQPAIFAIVLALLLGVRAFKKKK